MSEETIENLKTASNSEVLEDLKDVPEDIKSSEESKNKTAVINMLNTSNESHIDCITFQSGNNTAVSPKECIEVCSNPVAKVNVYADEGQGPDVPFSNTNICDEISTKKDLLPGIASLNSFNSSDSSSFSDAPVGETFHKSNMCGSQNDPLIKLKYYFSESESLSEFDLNSVYSDKEMPSSDKKERNPEKKKKRTKRSRPSQECYKLKLNIMENNHRKLLSELAELKEKVVTQDTEFEKRQNETKVVFEKKLEKLSVTCDSLKKDKELMVIRYANSEKEVIVAKKTLSEFEKKLKDYSKDREALTNKIKHLQMEKTHLSSMFDQKVNDLSGIQREYERLKEELTCKDIKIKWIQNKLKTESESHKETQVKLEHTVHRLQEMREEAEQVRKDCQEMIKCYQEAEEIKSVKLDHQLKQKLSELEVQRQERCDQEEVYQLLRHELEALKKKQRMTIGENNNLTVKIHGLEKERLEYEQTLSKLKDTQNSLKQEIVDLTARLSEMDNLSLQLIREKEKYSASAREVERLRRTNAELQNDMDACHTKEGELLEFTERLTAKTVQLQSEHSLLEIKSQTLEEDLTQLNRRYSELDKKSVSMANSLEAEIKLRQEETQLLAKKLAEKTKNVEQLNTKLGESDNENKVMKRRHITTIKELSRELQQCHKKLETYEESSPGPGDTVSLGSRASSSASLDAINNSATHGTPTLATTQITPAVIFSGGKTNITSQNSPQVSTVNEVNKQLLIERIVKLQKILAKKNDKIEFLEDHVSQLVKEMKKKSRIIQSYTLKIEPGALVSNTSDLNKFDLGKRGGIMASVYRSQLSDNNMTLELSLEINNKLQAVLEDTLLKNITLKENINTLGEEIARLTAEKREIVHQMNKNRNF